MRNMGGVGGRESSDRNGGESFNPSPSFPDRLHVAPHEEQTLPVGLSAEEDEEAARSASR